MEQQARAILDEVQRRRLPMPSFMSLWHHDREFDRKVTVDFLLVGDRDGTVFESIDEVEFDGAPQRWRIPA